MARPKQVPIHFSAEVQGRRLASSSGQLRETLAEVRSLDSVDDYSL